jgi:hypothetical protein
VPEDDRGTYGIISLPGSKRIVPQTGQLRGRQRRKGTGHAIERRVKTTVGILDLGRRLGVRNALRKTGTDQEQYHKNDSKMLFHCLSVLKWVKEGFNKYKRYFISSFTFFLIYISE